MPAPWAHGAGSFLGVPAFDPQWATLASGQGSRIGVSPATGDLWGPSLPMPPHPPLPPCPLGLPRSQLAAFQPGGQVAGASCSAAPGQVCAFQCPDPQLLRAHGAWPARPRGWRTVDGGEKRSWGRTVPTPTSRAQRSRLQGQH